MDVKMADLDGSTATRRLAADKATAHIPVIAVTASAFGDTRQPAKDAGCVEYVPKPVRAEAVFAALQTHLGVKFVSGSDADRRSRARARRRRARRAIAARLREALAMGAIGDLQKMADELSGGETMRRRSAGDSPASPPRFDFDGVRGNWRPRSRRA